MKRAYADVPEGQIHYLTEGSGQPVVLIHMGGSSSDEYRLVIPHLSHKYWTIALDLPGWGKSDKPPREYNLPDYTRSVISFMDALDIRKASIVGHHAGSKIAADLAATWPDRVDKLVLSSYPFFQDDKEQMSRRNDPLFRRVEIVSDGSHLMEWWRRAARYGDSPEIVEERLLAFVEAGPRGDELHWAVFAYSPKLKTMLPLIKSPTLLLSGSRDHWSEGIKDLKKLIPRNRAYIIENGPPFVTSVMPQAFAEVILEFLENPNV